jgi:hypothetical protein
MSQIQVQILMSASDQDPRSFTCDSTESIQQLKDRVFHSLSIVQQQDIGTNPHSYVNIALLFVGLLNIVFCKRDNTVLRNLDEIGHVLVDGDEVILGRKAGTLVLLLPCILVYLFLSHIIK